MYRIELGDSVELLKTVAGESVDLVVTSPPYDDLRNYNHSDIKWSFEIFKKIADQLYRVIKSGGVIIWVVADKTDNGSESCTSFKQALYFKETLGLNLHDTMIYRKENYTPLSHDRYEQEWEYMFCFSKGKPKTFNPIMVDCKYAGHTTWGNAKFYKTDDDNLTIADKRVINEKKIKGNIFSYHTGSLAGTGKVLHPAMFPFQLAVDQINSWSNEGDTVLDPFMGSGTTGVACVTLGRDFIGFECVPKYFDISKEEIDKVDIPALFRE